MCRQSTGITLTFKEIRLPEGDVTKRDKTGDY